MEEYVILVDEADNETGIMEKMEAHRKGLLHRAFSILLFNTKGEILLQKRAVKKYHSGGLWTNTCCSHPLPQESVRHAAKRKLWQEMGIDMQPEYAFKFIYKTGLDHELIEHEVDHVLIGLFDGIPNINPDEVEDWKFVNVNELKKEMIKHPDHYTYWFKLIVNHDELQQLTPQQQ
ncbi:MAG: isopentenyl-diphosphate delta-isomerase [Azospira oryzae]|jgi:isopentenyl-diphosphate delta-isomerase|nr:isopentenyl-diphosphate delta-isomerase [Cytophaga sp.]PZR32182.1 MAG: isopentenyl-diphosphate delta-isomerase [Azospira oryzae]